MEQVSFAPIQVVPGATFPDSSHGYHIYSRLPDCLCFSSPSLAETQSSAVPTKDSPFLESVTETSDEGWSIISGTSQSSQSSTVTDEFTDDFTSANADPFA